MPLPDALRRESGPLLTAAATVLGARCGERWPAVPAALCRWGRPSLVAAAVGAAGLAAFVGRRVRRSRPPAPLRRFAWLLAVAGVAAISMARALAGLGALPGPMAGDGAEARVVVRLAADPGRRWATALVPGRVEAIDGRPARGVVLVVAGGAAAERVRLLEAGESAVLTGWFRPLRAGERPWRWRHARAAFEARDLVGAGRAEPALLRAANGLRRRVLAGGAALHDTDRALVAGFLVGDERGLPAGVAADFRAAGLSHLLVVSGANVTLALALVGPVLRRFGLGGRLAGGLAVLVVFSAMTRFEPSVLRAAAMAGLAMLAAFLGRPVAGVRFLALAVTGLVLADPFLTHSLGFGLSCGASAGLLLFSRPIAARLPGPRLIREPLAMTAAAQLGVAPVALPVFGHLPLAALPANLAAAPAAAALSLWGLGAGLAGGLLGPGPAGLLQAPTAALAGWVRVVAHVAARRPVMLGPRAAGVIGAAAGSAWWRSGRGRAGPAPRPPGGSGADPRPALRVRRLRLGAEVGLQAEKTVEGQEPGPGQQHSGGGHGVEQVELEAGAARRADQADLPLHLGHDPEELQGDEGGPQP